MDHPVQTVWDELATAALMGSERRTPRLADPAGPLGAIVRGLTARGDGPESTLLATAAALSAYRRAGVRPLADPGTVPDPCPDDERPTTSPRSGGHLAMMLDGPYADALGEWLEAVAGAGRRIRDRDLVAVLEHARQRPEFRAAVLAVIGRRGGWLAAQNPDWSFAIEAAESAEGDWQTGSRDERLAQLRRLRASEPAHARDLLASTWSQETPPDRAAFLAALADGLSLDDEPFLEAALDDSRSEVRRAAADLLGRLPESRLCRRMIERLGPLIQFSDGEKGPGVEVTLPAAYTKDLARDGIARTQPGMGEKNGWLSQMIAVVPPSHWSGVTGRSPAELLAIAHRSEWDLLLSWGWCEAAQRHRDQPWLEAFSRQAVAQQEPGRLRDCLLAIDREPRQQLLTRLLAESTALMGPVFHVIAQAVPAPWDVAFSREVVDRILRHLDSGDRLTDPLMTTTLRRAGFSVATSLRDELAGLFPLDDPERPPLLLKAVREFLDAVCFRHEALAELAT